MVVNLGMCFSFLTSVRTRVGAGSSLFSKDSSILELLSEVKWCPISQLELFRVLLPCFDDFYMEI